MSISARWYCDNIELLFRPNSLTFKLGYCLNISSLYPFFSLIGHPNKSSYIKPLRSFSCSISAYSLMGLPPNETDYKAVHLARCWSWLPLNLLSVSSIYIHFRRVNVSWELYEYIIRKHINIFSFTYSDHFGQIWEIFQRGKPTVVQAQKYYGVFVLLYWYKANGRG